jgi:hypothetical protein
VNGVRFDPNVLSPETGVRAVWMMYRRGQWDRLEDFGIERAKIEPLLDKFDYEYIPGERLTNSQARRVAELVPEIAGAGVELRLAYALQYQRATEKSWGMEHIKEK